MLGNTPLTNKQVSPSSFASLVVLTVRNVCANVSGRKSDLSTKLERSITTYASIGSGKSYPRVADVSFTTSNNAELYASFIYIFMQETRDTITDDRIYKLIKGQ